MRRGCPHAAVSFPRELERVSGFDSFPKKHTRRTFRAFIFNNSKAKSVHVPSLIFTDRIARRPIRGVLQGRTGR